MDQFLANQLTTDGVLQVVTDPQRADTILTDRIGEPLESKFKELYPPPPPPERKERTRTLTKSARCSRTGTGPARVTLRSIEARAISSWWIATAAPCFGRFTAAQGFHARRIDQDRQARGETTSERLERQEVIRPAGTGALTVGWALATILILAPAAAQTPGYRAPRTADGQPDLNGIWQVLNTANWDLVGHAASAGPMNPLGATGAEPPGLGVVEGGEMPYLPEAEATKKENFQTPPGAGSGSEVLPARRASRHLYAVPVSNRRGARITS